MAEGGVVETFEAVRSNGREFTNVDLALAAGSGDADGGKVAGGDDRTAGREGQGGEEDLVIVGADAFPDGGDNFIVGLPGSGGADIALAEEGDGANDGIGEFVDGFGKVGGSGSVDEDADRAKEFARGIEGGCGIVIATYDESLTVCGADERGEEAVVLREGGLGRICTIKDVASNDEKLDGVIPDIGEQPVKEALVLRAAVVIDQTGSEVPVGSVKDGHESGMKLKILERGRCWAAAGRMVQVRIDHRMCKRPGCATREFTGDD